MEPFTTTCGLQTTITGEWRDGVLHFTMEAEPQNACRLWEPTHDERGVVLHTHLWDCLEHQGHPTGEQWCEDGDDASCEEPSRVHPSAAHREWHRATHASELAGGGGECWCAGKKG